MSAKSQAIGSPRRRDDPSPIAWSVIPHPIHGRAAVKVAPGRAVSIEDATIQAFSSVQRRRQPARKVPPEGAEDHPWRTRVNQMKL